MKSVWYLVIVFSHLNLTISLIPNICVKNATTSGICCPSPEWTDEVCGGESRGFCDFVTLKKDFQPFAFVNDDRMNWPSRFFHTLCICRGNYFGVACEGCFYGKKGRYCEQDHVEIRRNILSLSPRERHLLVKIIDRSISEPADYSIYVEQHNSRSDPIVDPEFFIPNFQYLMVYNHRLASRATLFTNANDCQNFGFLDFNHNAVGFLTWHRYFMMVWERGLQKIAIKYFNVHNFALPYWDWTDLNHCDICRNDLAGAEGPRHPEYGVLINQGSPFHNWTEYCVEPSGDFACYGCHKAGYLGRISRSWNNLRFPTSHEVAFALSKRNFYIRNERIDQKCEAFHSAAEGLCGQAGYNDTRLYLHNRIHNMLDGSMCCSGTSPSDPLFIFHHIQIDRLFQAWINKYKPSLTDYPDFETRPGHGKFSNLVSWIPLIKHAQLFTHSKNLGYVYDNYNFGRKDRSFY